MRKETQKNIQRRLHIIEGQIHGLQKMIDDDKYCVDIITQASAIRNALSAVEDLMLENHLSTHFVEQMKSGSHKRAVSEILSIYKLSKKK